MPVPSCIEIGGRTVPLLVHYRKEARYLRLRMNYRNQVTVSAPSHLSDNQVLSFLKSKHLWLERKMAATPELAHLNDWLHKHPFLSASGERFYAYVRIEECRQARYRFENEGPTVVFHVPQNSSDPEHVLLNLMRLFAKDALACRLNYLARQWKLNFERLTVRDQTSRWGSCSSKRCISLNWRLVLLEPELQDYVILHELAHLTEMNHSKRFWDLLEHYDPGCWEHESALKKRSDTIMRIGRS